MTAPTEKPEIGTRPSVALELDHRREAATLALREQQADLAEISDQEFERRLASAKRGYERMQRIFAELMVDGVHYGTKDQRGRNVFKSPDLTQAGVQLLERQFRLTPELLGEPLEIVRPDFVSVTATVQVRDGAGRICAVRGASCTSQEARFFERPRSKGFQDQAAPPIGDDEAPIDTATDAEVRADKRGKPLYVDAREVLHQCRTMAEKRARKLAVADATQWSAFQKDRSRAAIEAAMKAGARPWTQDEFRQVMKASERAGIKKKSELKALIEKTVAHPEPPLSGDEVVRVLAALAVYLPPATKADEHAPTVPIAGTGVGVHAGQPASPALSMKGDPYAEAPEALGRTAEDEQLDRELAGE